MSCLGADASSENASKSDEEVPRFLQWFECRSRPSPNPPSDERIVSGLFTQFPSEKKWQEFAAQTDSRFVEDGFRLLQLGAAAPFDNESFYDNTVDYLITTTPKEVRTAPQPLVLRATQIHSINRILYILKEHGLGVILALDMGLGKTLITIVVILILLKERLAAETAVQEDEDESLCLTEDKYESLHSIDDEIQDLSGRLSKFHGGALIIVPLSLLDHWEKEFKERTNPALKVLTYHGKKASNSKTVEELSRYDVVLTTYDTVRLEFETYENAAAALTNATFENGAVPFQRPMTPLLAVLWLMVVLEEGHKAANPTTTISCAVGQLHAQHRIVMTGTPLMNEYSDCQSLMSFLRMKPWSRFATFKEYFIRSRRPGRVPGSPVLNDYLNAILATCLRAITVRIKKDDYFNKVPVVDYPRGEEYRRFPVLRGEERWPQDWVKGQWDEATNMRQRKEGSGIPRSEIFRLITEARLALAHLACTEANYGNAANEDEVGDQRAQQSLKVKRKKFAQKINELPHTWQSSRMRLLVNDVKSHFENPDSGKILVFSEFLCVLDVAQLALADHGIETLRFDGSLGQLERSEVVRAFREDESPRVLLITNKSGGFGLDFTAADMVIHLTQTWNPAITDQCTHRAIRPKQKKNVKVIHYHSRDSMDDKTWATHQRKRSKASKLLDPDEDMKKLMSEVGRWDQREYEEMLEQAKQMVASIDKSERKKKPSIRRRGKLASKKSAISGMTRQPELSASQLSEPEPAQKKKARVDYTDMDVDEERVDGDYIYEDTESDDELDALIDGAESGSLEDPEFEGESELALENEEDE